MKVLNLNSYKLILFTFISLSTSSTWAAITVSSAQGVSATKLTSGVTPALYGGLAGSCAADTLSTCDSCATAATLQTCNRARINPALRLRIYYSSNSVDGRPILTSSDGASVISTSATTVTKGNTATIDVPWTNVCTHLTTNGGLADCTSATSTSISASLKIGIDVNSNGTLDTGDESTALQVTVINPDAITPGDFDTIDDCATNLGVNKPGICYFMAYPGDEKIFFESSESGLGFPTTTLGTISQINLYASTTGFITKPSDATPHVLTIEDTDITNKVVDGLENGLPHYFRVSVSDPAGNEMYFTSDAAILAECSGTLTPTAPFDGTSGGQLCPFAAIPDEVVGLLTKNVNCFIATAAFGSSLHPLVEDFRHFRDQFLMPHRWGRKLVNWYYGWSPEAAHWLRHHDWSKTVVRAALIPVWLGTKAIIWWPITLALLLVGLAAWRRTKMRAKSV